MSMTLFKGAGGGIGGGSSSTPTDTPDNLSSTDQVEVVLGLCQGPIKGLTNGNQSFYVGTTQLENADGTTNFDLFDLTVYPGDTPAAPIIPVLGGYEDYRVLNFNQPNTYPLNPGETASFGTVTSNLTQIVILINVGKCYQSGSDVQLASIPGNMNTFSTFLPFTFAVNVTYQASGGAEINPFGGPQFFTRKTQVSEPLEIRFTVSGNGPWTVNIRNLTAPDNYNNFLNLYLEGFFEVQGGLFGFARSNTINTLMVIGEPLIRTTMPPNQNPNGTVGINMIGVRIDINQLLKSDTSGTDNAFVTFRIESKPTSLATWDNPFGGDVVVWGKTTTLFVQDYRWVVDQIVDTYDVRITIVSPALAGVYISAAWESMQEIVGGPMTYDGVACVYILAQATGQFSSVPTLSGEYDLLLCHIPTNYDPYGRTYTGAWDGTFKLDWTSNPAFCLYETAMNATWGAASYWPHLSLNKYDIYAAAQWCDTLVPNGQGGYQPRYTYNGLIASARGIRDQLRYMAGTFNGTFLDDLNGNTRVVFDGNEDAVAIFTQENVIEGLFSYTYTDPSTRFNYITGSYDEPNLNYQTVPLVVQSAPEIARYGLTTTEIALVGCTNAHEALRRLTYKLVSATTEVEIVSFSTNRMGLLLRPFNVILVSDPDMGNGLSGRIRDLDATRTLVYLRDLIVLEMGVTYYFQTYHTNPNYPATSSDPLELVSIPFQAFVSAGAFAIELTSPLPADIASDAAFTVGAEGTPTGVPKAYRITSIEEAQGNPDAISIQAIEINRNKGWVSDNATMQSTYDAKDLGADIAPPSNFHITTVVTSVNGQAIANVIATWNRSTDARVIGYILQYRKAGDTTWTKGAVTTSTQADIYNVPDGTYDFALQAQSLGGPLSSMVYLYGKAAGLNVPPSDVASLIIVEVPNGLNLQWTAIPDGDLSYYWVRYSPITDGTAQWVTATDLVPQVLATSIQVPILAGTYFVKAVDTSGAASVNAASAVTSGIQASLIVVENVEQSPTWSWLKTNMTVDSYGVLCVNLSGGNTGSYTWDSEDFGTSYIVTLSLALVASGSNLHYHMSDWTTLAAVTNLAGLSPGDISVQTFIALSTDGTTYGAFQPFATGNWTGRRFRFKVELTSNTTNIVPMLVKCAAVISMMDRVTRATRVLVPSTGLEVLFSPIFHAVPTVVPAILNAQSGDYFGLTDVTNGGFIITCYDNTNTAVSRYASYVVVGYGVS